MSCTAKGKWLTQRGVQTIGGRGIMETSEQYRGRTVSPERKTVHRTIVDMNDSLCKRLALRPIIFSSLLKVNYVGKTHRIGSGSFRIFTEQGITWHLNAKLFQDREYAVTKIVFWGWTPCILAELCECFGGTRCLHFEVQCVTSHNTFSFNVTFMNILSIIWNCGTVFYNPHLPPRWVLSEKCSSVGIVTKLRYG
jgi:hypothetical protein